jgi:hypothetical protein
MSPEQREAKLTQALIGLARYKARERVKEQLRAKAIRPPDARDRTYLAVN